MKLRVTNHDPISLERPFLNLMVPGNEPETLSSGVHSLGWTLGYQGRPILIYINNPIFLSTVSSAQRELGKSLPSNASATAPPAGTVDNAIRTGVAVEPPRPTPRTGPYFDLAASKNVTALLGKTAYLNCRVKNLGNKTVSLL